MTIGTEVAIITAGIDRLYRHVNAGAGVLDREGLVPVYLVDVVGEEFADWAEADARLAEVEGRLPAVADAMRRAYLAEMIDSLRALVATFRGEALSYAERVRRCLRVPSEPVPEPVLAAYRATISHALDELGYGSMELAQALPQWESDQQVAQDEVLPALRHLLHQAV